MAPLLTTVRGAAKFFARSAIVMSSEMRMQWVNPGNVLDILLLVGGDVVRAALAQLTGSYWPTPVVFSFGWVAYSFVALVSVIGDKRLMPPPDVPGIIINASTGYARENQSWILGRLLRDFEDGYWMHPEIKKKLQDMLNPPVTKPPASAHTSQVASDPPVAPRRKAGLCISIYKACAEREAAYVAPGLVFYLGYVVALAQMVIAALPWILWRSDNYFIIVVTIGGTLLAFWTATLPQWRREKFDCRRKTKSDYILTRGNGSQHALVILGQGNGLNLEDMASAGDGQRASRTTRFLVFCFTILWVVLLVTVDGLSAHTWFLVAVGSLGSLYTALVAGLPKLPEQYGIPLVWTKCCIVNEKVMTALMEAEEFQSGLGRAMVGTFFPGSMSANETAFWNAAEKLHNLKNPASVNKKVDAKAVQGIQKLEAEIQAFLSGSNATP